MDGLRPLPVLAVTANAVLIAMLGLWHADTPWFAAVVTVPLLFPLPGLWRGRAYTYAWTSLLTLVYLAFLITEFWVAGDRRFAGPALFAGAALFLICLTFVRLNSSRSGFSRD